MAPCCCCTARCTPERNNCNCHCCLRLHACVCVRLFVSMQCTQGRACLGVCVYVWMFVCNTVCHCVCICHCYIHVCVVCVWGGGGGGGGGAVWRSGWVFRLQSRHYVGRRIVIKWSESRSRGENCGVSQFQLDPPPPPTSPSPRSVSSHGASVIVIWGGGGGGERYTEHKVGQKSQAVYIYIYQISSWCASFHLSPYSHWSCPHWQSKLRLALNARRWHGQAAAELTATEGAGRLERDEAWRQQRCLLSYGFVLTRELIACGWTTVETAPVTAVTVPAVAVESL